jgi:gamma-glutamylcyclotransferase (GGCT)/AIG2-like uncharacterized protein YtfP
VESLFVYGTLRPGGGNYPLLQGSTVAEEPAVADGLALYGNWTGSFPYAVAQPGRAVFGTLCTVTDQMWPAVRRRLDLLEGFHPSHPDNSHYIRRRWPVRTTTTADPAAGDPEGRSTIAWLYLATQRTRIDPARLVAGGDWLNR